MLFEADYANARLPDGTRLSFTRSEARALEALISSGGRVMTRNQLLDAVSEEGSEKNDRNIDFLINRVRRKLGDSAKDPKFIATRYGEGYVWLDQAAAVHAEIVDADIVIGPARGLDNLPLWRPLARDLIAIIDSGIRTELGPEPSLSVSATAEPVRNTGAAREISIDLSFFENLGAIECILSAKMVKTGMICFVERLQLGTDPEEAHGIEQKMERLVPLVLARSWEVKTKTHGQSLPLPVAMHEASGRDEQHELTWRENDQRLQTLRKERPDDPSVKLMYATHLHTKYVTLGFELFRKGEATCADDEAEIEGLVLEALEFAQTRPEHAVMAAKLLYFVDKGYRDLSIDLMETALDTTSSIASTLAIAGQFKAFLGETDDASHYLRQAMSLSEKGSTFYIYALVMLCQALMATNRLDELSQARGELYSLLGIKSVFFEPMFADPYNPSLKAKAFAMMLPRSRAKGILQNLFYVSGRLFQSEEHRENAMRTPVSLFARRFGPDILTDEMRAAMPNLGR